MVYMLQHLLVTRHISYVLRIDCAAGVDFANSQQNVERKATKLNWQDQTFRLRSKRLRVRSFSCLFLPLMALNRQARQQSRISDSFHPVARTTHQS